MRTFNKQDLLLIEGISKEKKYISGVGKNGTHLGQAKLFFSELLFLTNYFKKGDKVLYIGSSRGKHINFFPELFPGIEVHCYDPSESEIDTSIEGIYEYRTLFGPKETEEWKEISKETRVLLICDIRSFNPKEARTISKELEEEKIIIDMRLQESWVLEINPYAFHLKFRLPYYYGGDEYFSYIDGDVYIQAWNHVSSTEHRLVGIRDGEWKIKKWNIKRYEDMCFYHNYKMRNAKDEKHMFFNIITKKNEDYNDDLRNDIEGSITVYTIMNYLNKTKKINKESKKNDILDKVNEFYFDIMEKITYKTKSIKEAHKKLEIYLYKNKYVEISKEIFSYKGIKYDISTFIRRSKREERIYMDNINEKDREYLLKNIDNKKVRYILKWYPIGKSLMYTDKEFKKKVSVNERPDMIKYIRKRKFKEGNFYDILDNCYVSSFIEYEADIDFFERIFNLMRQNTLIENKQQIRNNNNIIDRFFDKCIEILE